jgi:hypothetical protein
MTELVEPTAGPVETKTFPDLHYTVVATPYSHYVEYKMYKVSGFGMDGTPVYGPKFLEDINEAKLFMHGSVKWDGCSNWWFEDMGRNSYIHSCSKEDLLDIGKIMAECWDWTATLCPEWDR